MVYFADVEKVVSEFLLKEKVCPEGYSDPVAALVVAVAKIFPSGQVVFQLFHETVPIKDTAETNAS